MQWVFLFGIGAFFVMLSLAQLKGAKGSSVFCGDASCVRMTSKTFDGHIKNQNHKPFEPRV